MINAIGISYQRFKSAPLVSKDLRADWRNEDEFEMIPIQPETSKKIRRQSSAAEISCGYGANLLANDTGIILRQCKASLMLLF
jgi:hypothetical protein